MHKSIRFIAGAFALALVSVFSAAHADDVPTVDQGLKNESEAGIVINSGNANSQSYNFKQTSMYGFNENQFKLTGHFLKTTAKDVTSARNWDLGLRYERYLFSGISVYLGQNVESDVFAGYIQRYNTDVGGKYSILKSEDYSWNAEAGYRFSSQNANDGTQVSSHFLRLYTEASRSWTKNFSAKYWLEFLPNLTDSSGYRINTELSISSILTSVFSIKSAYGIRFNNTPPDGAANKTDSAFTTSLVAKF